MKMDNKNKQLIVLPPIKVKSIMPTERYLNSNLMPKASTILKAASSSLNNLANSDLTKSSSIKNRQLIIKLNSIKFLNGILYHGKNARNLDSIETKPSVPDTRPFFPNFYSSSFNLLKNLENDKSVTLPNINNNSDIYSVSSDGKSIDVNINFKNTYELVSILKQDGLFSMQTVLICLKSNSKQKFLMKKLDLAESTSTNGISKKQLDEYESMLNNSTYISNLNLTRIKETYLSKDLKSFYIISEYCTDSFEHVLRMHYAKREFIQFSSILNWFMQSLSAISFLHSHCNLIHSNLKPSNFLLQNNVLKLADFGYINIRSRFKYLLKLVNDPVNRLYLPMETFRAYKYTFKSDIYSIGAVFYELLVLENYNFLKESLKDKIRHRLDDKHEAFVLSLISMLNNTENDRPRADELRTLFEWDNSFESTNKLKDGLFSKTLLGRFKNSIQIYKKISLNPYNKPLITEILVRLISSDEFSHENLIFPNRFLILDRSLFLLRDYSEDSVNLRQKLDLTVLTESVLLNKWVNQIINGLEFLHSKSILHGNLKCENIIFNSKEQIKLTDFGFYHLLDQDSEENYALAQSADVYMLGAVLFKCLTRKDLNYDDRVEELIANSDFTENTKNTVLSMIDPDAKKRPDLKNLLSSLINTYFLKLTNNSYLTTEINGRTKCIVSNDREFLLITALKKKIPKDYLVYHSQKIRAKDSNTQLACEKLSLNSGTNKISMDSLSCDCASRSMASYKGGLNDFPNTLPKMCCLVNYNYTIGCNSEFIYLLDDQFRYIRIMCLFEMLEMKPPQSSNLTQIRKSNHHSSLINRFNLKLDVQAICYDKRTKRVYLLITIHNQYCLLNILDLDLTLKPKLSLNITNYTENIQLISQKPQISTSINFNLYLNNTIHIPILNSNIIAKSMCCNDNYLFICEKNFLVRAFSKENGKYLFTITQAANIIEPPIIGNNSNRPLGTPFSMLITNLTDSQEKESNLLDEFQDGVQDIGADLRGNLYVAYGYMLKVFSPTCNFLWKHEFSRRSINGKVTHLCVNKSSLAVITQDEKMENINRIYSFI